MTLREKFEAVFLEGKVRENILVASQLQLGADGEYFNQNTRVLFQFYQRGHADALDGLPAAVEEIEPEPLFEPADITPARKPEPGCDTCAGKGDGRGNECDDCWIWAEIPF